MVTILKEMGQISLRRKSGTRRSVSDLLLLMGFIVVPLSLCVGELVTPALADFLDHCPKDCNCKWANGKREADCTRAGFTAVPTHLDHEIQILRMTHSYVRVLGNEVFKAAGLLNLQRIFMNHCHVQEIHSMAFKNLRILVELDLSNNNLTHLEPETFSGNERLQTLTLSHNKIASIAPYVFPLLKHLKTIDLSHNFIDEIHRHTFENLGNSVEALNIDNNRLGALREEVFLPLTNLKSLQLHSNPWNCDCHLKNFRDWVVYRGLYTYPTSCQEPERLADKLWQDVDPKDFACKPDIRVPQSVVFSQPGANVTLSCFIIGNPMPDAKWVLKGRIVNNNTVPSGGPAPPPAAAVPPTSSSSLESTTSIYSSTTTTTTTWWSTTPGMAGANTNAAMPQGPTQYLIHEEGGLERWFNLTITNVGVEAVADYTCVAVNAGGVMEEAITLTFEEPEPVGLPGGKKETQESNVAIIIGAAAGGILFGLILLLTLCCCCCRRRVKSGGATSTSSTSSHSGGTTGLDMPGSLVGFTDSHQKLLPSSPESQSYSKAFPPSFLEMKTSKSSQIYGDDYNQVGIPPAPLRPNCDNMENLPVLRSPRMQQPKTLMVTSSSITGENFHTGFTDPDQYPDLLNIHPKHPSSPKVGQPLNPAALVMPPTPPAQFPHQFQHLIHHNKPVVSRAHSPTNQSVLVSPLLSPPAQFSSPRKELRSSANQVGYVTLPRKLTSSSSRGPIDWSVMTDRPPIYDGIGPRTSATGTGSQTPAAGAVIINELNQPKRSSSLKRFPTANDSSSSQQSSNKSRDSSGSEVTLGGEDSFTAYCEPFGKAMQPTTSNNHKNTCSTTTIRPDSIASAVDSDLEAMLIGDGPFASSSALIRRRKSCPMHKGQTVGPKIINIPADTSKPIVQVSKGPKQLKGILKGGKSNITSNPMAPADQANLQQSTMSNNSSSRDSSSACSDSTPPPLTDATLPVPSSAAIHISKAPKPPLRTSSSMNSKNMSEALHV